MSSSSSDDDEVSSSSSEAPARPQRGNVDGLPLVPIIPPGAKAVWLSRQSANLPMSATIKTNADGSASNPPGARCINHESCLESDTSVGLDNTAETIGNTPIDASSSCGQAASMNGDNVVLPVSGDVTSSHTFEQVAVQMGTVLLKKCTVFELSSLDAVSSRLREVAITTMRERSLNIYFELSSARWEDARSQIVFVPVMYIDDITDQSRNTSIEFYETDGTSPPPLYNTYDSKGHYVVMPIWQKLLYFCGYANIKHIELDANISRGTVMYPNQFAMKYVRTSNFECALQKFFADELFVYGRECGNLLNVVSPRFLVIACVNEQEDLDAALNSRGMAAVKSLIILSNGFHCGITDEHMLKLCAISITYHTVNYIIDADIIFSKDYPCLVWTPVGVSEFIKQWLQGSRVIEKVVYQLVMVADANDTTAPAVKFGQTLVEELGKLDQPPQMDVLTNFDVEVLLRLQTMMGGDTDQGFLVISPDVYGITITAGNGRQLTIELFRAWNRRILGASSTGFIHIFPSN